MMRALIVEDNPNLRPALKAGLEATGEVKIVHDCDSGEEALTYSLQTVATNGDGGSLQQYLDVILMDVQLSGEMNGIEATVAIRREFPRFPVVFYSIQDDDAYYRAFLQARLLSHYAYVRKSNFLLPNMLIPLLKDAIAGKNYIDPDVEVRVREVHHKDKQDPMTLLEPNEQIVARMLAQGLTNEEIAMRMGYKDKRTISRVNGQIYTVWGLNQNPTDEKIARTRAAIIVQSGRFIKWNDKGKMQIQDSHNNWVDWDPLEN